MTQRSDVRIKQLLSRSRSIVGIDILSLQNAKGAKYREITEIRDLIMYILIEEYPKVSTEELLGNFPSLKRQTKKTIEQRVHRRMNGNTEYIDLYRKIKNGK